MPFFGDKKTTLIQKLIISLSRHTPLGRGGSRKILTHILRMTRKDFIDITALGCKFRAAFWDNNPEMKMIMRPDQYAPDEINFLKSELMPNDIFVDIGANAGIFSLVAAKELAGTGKVIGFEPNPEMFRRLNDNAALNPGTRIITVQAAVSDKTGTVWFNCNDKEQGGSHISTAQDQESTETESCILHEKLLELGISRISGIKIDIEGHEDKVIHSFLAQDKIQLPRFIIMETIFLDEQNSCLNSLLKYGYRPIHQTAANICLLLDRAYF